MAKSSRSKSSKGWLKEHFSDQWVSKAQEQGHDLTGSVAASDAFFPFPDGVEALHEAGVRAVIQPGGSIRDKAVISACDRLGMAMVMTGQRHFRH